MSLTPGTRLGPYEVVAAIGAGGMGEVYRATDTKLKRQVALKILPPALAADRDRLLRFQREAEVLASLNHPNIAGIYGLEDSGSPGPNDADSRSPRLALVMELVEGQTLADLIATGPPEAKRVSARPRDGEAGVTSRGGGAPRGLEIDDAVAIAKQIAEALEAAHEQGIIHRDLKPANIKVRADGTVKVLDFGLAKALAPEAGAAAGEIANSPTITSPAMTQMGMILGTAAYMSPEQARGKPVDKRADIWAFGCVLFEMVTGKRAFRGDDVTETLAAVITQEPDWTALPERASVRVGRLLRRCLEKDRARRLRDIGDARLELDDSGTQPAPAPLRRDRAWMAWAAAVVVAGMGAGVLGWQLRRVPPAAETRLEIMAPQASETPQSFALSPDGRQIVYAGRNGNQYVCWLRALDSLTARALPGTENAINPFWSPDSRSIAFFVANRLMRMDVASGALQTIADSANSNAGGAWSADDVVLFVKPGAGWQRVSASGGDPVALAPLPNSSQPRFLPGGRRFLFYRAAPEKERGIHVGSLDGEEPVHLIDSDSAGEYLPSGWLLFVRQGSLVARRFDPSARSLSGEAVLIAENVWFGGGSQRRAAFSVSTQGMIAYRDARAARRQLTWFDRTGKVLGTLGEPDATMSAPDLSPDGTRVAVRRYSQGSDDIWLIDAHRTTPFTLDATAESFPVWSPDGSRIGFVSLTADRRAEYVKPVGGGTATLLAEGPTPTAFLGMTDWSSDGKFVLVDKNPVDIWVIPTDGRKPFPFIDGTAFQERVGRFSPDGRWVAYQSNESRTTEIYVRAFTGRPEAAAGERRWQISTAGGTQPHWRADGKELYWIAPDASLMAASIRAQGDVIEAGLPVPLFQTRIYLGGRESPDRGQYDVARDGRFLINTLLGEDASWPIAVLQNWAGRARD